MYYQNEPRFNGAYSGDNLSDKTMEHRWSLCNKS